jgi:hypothetical protein
VRSHSKHAKRPFQNMPLLQVLNSVMVADASLHHTVLQLEEAHAHLEAQHAKTTEILDGLHAYTKQVEDQVTAMVRTLNFHLCFRQSWDSCFDNVGGWRVDIHRVSISSMQVSDRMQLFKEELAKKIKGVFSLSDESESLSSTAAWDAPRKIAAGLSMESFVHTRGVWSVEAFESRVEELHHAITSLIAKEACL